jgi:Domain of unknown function (DUF1844)
MSEEQPSYKVTDRRLFNADGTPRDVPESERAEPATTTAEANSTADLPAVPPIAANEVTPGEAEPSDSIGAAPSTVADQTSAQDDETVPEMDLPGAEDPASFASFMMSIASNAASSLGMMEHPVTGKREVDLELGKHWIDILGMLQQKTRGNLLPQEQQILEGLLSDLRMQFVSLTNATPKARSFSSRDITGG